MRQRCELESALASAVQDLPDRELEVLTRIAARLVNGLQQYGPLAEKIGNPRWNWRREANEEAMDAAVYLAVSTMEP